MQIERQLISAIKCFENVLLSKDFEVPKIFRSYFVPEFFGIDISGNKLKDIKFYYIPAKKNARELMVKNDTLKKNIIESIGHSWELSPIMDETIRLFDYSLAYDGHNNTSERIVFKCDSLNSNICEEVILNCIRKIDYHQITSNAKSICAIIQNNIATKKYPLHLFGFSIDFENKVIGQVKTYFSLLQFKNRKSYYGIHVDEKSLSSCREIIHLMGLSNVENDFYDIYKRLSQNGASLDFLGINYTPELSKSLKAYFMIDKALKDCNSEGFDMKLVYTCANKQPVIEETLDIMKKYHYTPAIVGIGISEDTNIDIKVYFEKIRNYNQ